jgi:hypothetical protein
MNFLAHHQFLLGVGSLWAFSAFVSGMPAPDSTSGKGYRWAYGSLHVFSANLDKFAQSYLKQSQGENKNDVS